MLHELPTHSYDTLDQGPLENLECSQHFYFNAQSNYCVTAWINGTNIVYFKILFNSIAIKTLQGFKGKE